MASRILLRRYRLAAQLGAGGASRVYRAEDLYREHEHVALKLVSFAGRKSTTRALLRFHREARALTQLVHPNIVRVFDVGVEGDHGVITMEHLRGRSLRQILNTAPPDVSESLRIILATARALACAHRHGIIHRDIKPENVFIEEPSGDVRVLDFGIASFTEMDSLDEEHGIGTVAYMSPEQAGVGKSGPDPRSDQYSLGVMTYEMFCGKRPFISNSRLELLRQHALSRPPDLRFIDGRDRPVLASFVRRLLEKQPERRFGSMHMLIDDLLAISEGRPTALHTLVPSRPQGFVAAILVGREEELATLSAVLDDARRGYGGLVTVSGPSGIGKSRLVEQLRDQALTLVSGKCLPLSSRTPYYALAEAFTELSALAHAPLPEARELRERIVSATEETRAQVLRVCPALKDLLGESTTAVRLDPGREVERFYSAIVQFLCTLGRPSSPIVVFLDDLQWIDTATLAILERLAPKLRESHTLLIAAWRTDNSGDTDALALAMERLSPSARIGLDALDHRQTRDLIESTLVAPVDAGVALADKLIAVTEGRPLFLIESLRGLIDDAILRYDQTQNRWHVDLPRLDAFTAAVPADLVLQRFRQLDPVERQVLQIAALLGNHFGRTLLTEAGEIDADTVTAALERALRLGLVVAEGQPDTYVFQHDIVRETAVNEMNAEARRRIHNRLGAWLATREVYAAAKHYWEAGNWARIAEFCHLAGTHALTNYSGRVALELLNQAAVGHRELGDTDLHTLAQLRCAIGSALLLLGEYDTARHQFEWVLAHSDDRDLCAMALRQSGRALRELGDFTAAVHPLRQALKMTGLHLPDSVAGLFVWLTAQAAIQVGHSIRTPRQLAPERQVLAREQIELLYELTYCYYFIDLARCLHVHITSLNLADRVAPCREVAPVFGGHGVLVSTIPLPARAIRFAERGIAISRQIEDLWAEQTCLLWKGLCLLFCGDWDRARQTFGSCLSFHRRVGDPYVYAVATENLGLLERDAGNLHVAAEHFRRAVEVCEESSDRRGIVLNAVNMAYVLYILGEDENGRDYERLADYYHSQLTDYLILGAYFVAKSRIHLQAKRIEEARDAGDQALEIIERYGFTQYYITDAYAAQADALIALAERDGLSPRLARQIKRTCRRALREGKRYPYFKIAGLRVAAAAQSLLGDPLRAVLLARESVSLAKGMGATLEAARSYHTLTAAYSQRDEWDHKRLTAEKRAAHYLQRSATAPHDALSTLHNTADYRLPQLTHTIVDGDNVRKRQEVA